MKKRILTIIITLLMLISACEKDGQEGTLIITTDDIALFSEGIYVLKGRIVSVGREPVTEYGFCWSQSVNPPVSEKKICLGVSQAEGSFGYTLLDVSPDMTYYVRAFASAGSVTYYGEVKSFTTPVTLVPKVMDVDGNIYYSVKIGDQVWMGSNLKATRYSDGSPVPRVEDQQEWFDFSIYTSAYCWYENYGAIGATYGALYTWPAAMRYVSADDVKPGNVQGVCPDGWHIPSDTEWKQLEIYLGMSLENSDAEGWRGTDEGGKLKQRGTQQWQAPNTGATDASGFTAIPGGWRDGAGYFRNLGTGTRFWSSTNSGYYSWMRELDYKSSQVYRGIKGLYEGIQVRCVRDN